VPEDAGRQPAAPAIEIRPMCRDDLGLTERCPAAVYLDAEQRSRRIDELEPEPRPAAA
jgi:hypothetical protein